MRNLKSKLSLLLAILMTTSPTMVFAQMLPVDVGFMMLTIFKESEDSPESAVKNIVDRPVFGSDYWRDIDNYDKNDPKSIAKLQKDLNENRYTAMFVSHNICADLQAFANYESLTKNSSDKAEGNSLSSLLKNTKNRISDSSEETPRKFKSSYLNKLFFLDNDQKIVNMMKELINTPRTASYGDAEKKFYNTCREDMQRKLAAMQSNRFLKAILPNEEDIVEWGGQQEYVLSRAPADQRCYEDIIKSGIYDTYHLSCDEGLGDVLGERNRDMANLYAKISLPLLTYTQIGDPKTYCNDCMKTRYDHATGNKDSNDFDKDKEKLKKKLSETLAKKASTASIMKFTKHMEDVLKMNNQRPSIKGNNDRFKDFYCEGAIESALQRDCGAGKRSAANKRALFNDSLKELGLCQNDANCSQLRVRGVLTNLEKKVFEKEGSTNSCQNLDFVQAANLASSRMAIKSTQILFDSLKGFDNDLMKGLLLYEMQTEKDQLKALSKVLSKLIVSNDDIYSVSMSDIINKSDSFEKFKKSFEKEHGVSTFKNNWLDRYANGNLKKRGRISDDLQKSMDGNGELLALRTYLSSNEENTTPAEKIERMLKKAMSTIPEMKVSFGSVKGLFENLDLGKKNGDSFINKAIGSSDAKEEYKIAKELFSVQTENYCTNMKKELEEALCLDEKSPLTNFSPTDIAEASQDIQDKTPGFKTSDILALSSLSCSLNSSEQLSEFKKTGDPARILENPSNFALSHSNIEKAKIADARDIKDEVCNLVPGSTVENAQIAYKSFRGEELSEEEKRLAEKYYEEFEKINESTTTGYAGAATSVFEKEVKSYQKAAARSGNGDVLYGGHNYSNNNKPIGSQVSSSLSSISNADSSQTTGHSGDVGYTGSSSSDTSSYAAYGESDNSGASEVTPINPNLLGVTPVSTPSYYPSYYSTSSVNHNLTDNANAIQNLNKQIPKGVTDYDEYPSAKFDEFLEKLTNNSSSKEENEELVEIKKKLAELEKELKDANNDLVELRKKEVKEANDPLNNVRKISAEPLSDNTMVISGSRNTSKAYEGAISNINRNAAVNNVSNTDSYGSNDVTQTSSGFSGGSVAGSQNTNAALTYKHFSSFSTTSEGKAKVPYSEVDRYLSYIGEHNVAGNQIIKRNSQGELVVLIPNMKGELVPVDVSELSESELEALEQKVAELFENQEKAGVLVADGVNVNTGRSIASVVSLEEKIATLKNEVGNVRLSALRYLFERIEER